MQKLMKSRKGFTLIELIVVIVIIAILIAALTPAILGVIRRANKAADEADLRTVMMAGSVAGTLITPPDTPAGANIPPQITGGGNVVNGAYELWFEGAVCVGGRITGGRWTANTGEDAVSIGQITGTANMTLTKSGTGAGTWAVS